MNKSQENIFDEKVSKLLEVLELSKSDEVASLTAEQLNHCFQWSHYFSSFCENLQNDAFVESLNKRLQVLSTNHKSFFGESCISMDILKDSNRILFNNFLQNKYFPSYLLPKLISGKSEGFFDANFTQKISEVLHKQAIWKYTCTKILDDRQGNLEKSSFDVFKNQSDSYFMSVSLQAVLETRNLTFVEQKKEIFKIFQQISVLSNKEIEIFLKAIVQSLRKNPSLEPLLIQAFIEWIEQHPRDYLYLIEINLMVQLLQISESFLDFYVSGLIAEMRKTFPEDFILNLPHSSFKKIFKKMKALLSSEDVNLRKKTLQIIDKEVDAETDIFYHLLVSDI